jgi:hypothetical protein
MSILIGVLLYLLCIAFLCALTGANRLDEERSPRPQPRPQPQEEAASATAVPSASQVHG